MGAGVVDVDIVEAYAEVGDEPEASAVLEELGSGGAVKDGAEDLSLGKESLKLLEGKVPAFGGRMISCSLPSFSKPSSRVSKATSILAIVSRV